jgi:gamma-glutamyl phosphate reductase
LMLLKQEECVDLIIPRGGEGLIRFVVMGEGQIR